MSSRWGRFLKVGLNRLTKRLARRTKGSLAIVRHTGRRSGMAYETPVIVRRTTGGFVIELTYGPGVDWYRNIVAAGGCRILWHGTEYTMEGLEPMEPAAGLAAFTPGQRLVLRLLRRRHFVRILDAQPEV